MTAALSRAQQALVVEALPMARRIARGFVGQHKQLTPCRADIEQAAAAGVVEAAARFDPSRGVTFVTHAFPWVTLYVREAGRAFLNVTRVARSRGVVISEAAEDARTVTVGRAARCATCSGRMEAGERAIGGPDRTLFHPGCRRQRVRRVVEQTRVSGFDYRDGTDVHSDRHAAAPAVAPTFEAELDAARVWRTAPAEMAAATGVVGGERAAAIYLRVVFGGESGAEVGREMGLSRQRIDQIVKKTAPAFDAWAAEVVKEAA